MCKKLNLAHKNVIPDLVDLYYYVASVENMELNITVQK